jgi:hypothetical protein
MKTAGFGGREERVLKREMTLIGGWVSSSVLQVHDLAQKVLQFVVFDLVR